MPDSAASLSKVPSLRHNFAWTFAGNAIYAGCQWGVLIALAKLTNPEMVGDFALALAITAPVFMFGSLQLRIVQATDAGHEYRFTEYFSLRLICTCLGLLAVGAIALVLAYRASLTALILIVAVAKGIESISDVIYGLLQQGERMHIIARSMMLKGVLSVAALTLAIYFTGSVVSGAIALAAAWLLVLLTYDLPCALRIVAATEFRPRFPRSRLLKLTWLTLPMGLVMMLISLNTNIPRYFIERIGGPRQLGIFAAMAYTMQAGAMVMNAIGNVVTPRLAKYYAERRRKEFLSLLGRLLAIAAALGLATVLGATYFGHTFLTLIYRPEYSQYTGVFQLLMIAAAISYVGGCLGTAVSAARCFAGQFPVNVAASLAGLLCSYLAVSRWGLAGAALTVAVIASLSAIGYAGLLVRKLGQSG